jgi:malate synthase
LASYAERLVEICHRRGAHAIGGMAAFVPDRSDEVASQIAIDLVLEDKTREAAIGYDGTWVAHPHLVAVATAAFDKVLGERPNQLELVAERASLTSLTDTATPGARYTLAAAERNLSIAHEYLVCWLGGRGAIAIDHLMEDLATAEISRAQIWQWLHSGTKLEVNNDVPVVLEESDVSSILAVTGDRLLAAGYPADVIREAASILTQAVCNPELPPFLSLLAMDALERFTATRS